MSDEQRLNSLNRFRKDPGQLILEEHSHCEVPAGCGGVVLRWRTRAVLPVIIWCYQSESGKWFLDGAELTNGRVDLPAGRHVLACAFPAVDPSSALILLAATENLRPGASTSPVETARQPLKVVSAEDGSWKYTLEEPDNDWALPSFDAGNWPALSVVPAPSFPENGSEPYQVRNCVELGAACLGLPRPASVGRVGSWWRRLLGSDGSAAPPTASGFWIRKIFEVPEDVATGPRS